MLLSTLKQLVCFAIGFATPLASFVAPKRITSITFVNILPIMSSATQLRLAKIFGPDFLAQEDLASIEAINTAPWNHDGHPKDLLLQPSGPSPTDNHSPFSQPLLEDDLSRTATALQAAFYTANSRATRWSPGHRVWSRSQKLAILS